MERLRQLLSQIGAQLGVLSVSQRVAIGLCAAMVVGSLAWLVQWSVQPDMVPLLTHDFSYDQLDAAEQALRTNGVTYRIVEGTRIYVRAAERHNALRLLNTADALPEGSLFDMATVVTESSPFQAPEARRYAQTYAKGNELAKIIATSPAVTKASVLLNPVTKRRLGGGSDVPTASVTVTLAPGVDMSHEMVEGFAKLVAGAVAGLKPHNVYITDARSLRSYNLPHPDDAASLDILSLVKRHEQHYRAKILNKLADIPGVQVAVTVELDTTKRVTQNVKHDRPQPKKETSSSSEQSGVGPGIEPGVQANVGQAITGAAASGSGNIREETMVENFEPKLTQTETVERLPFGVKRIAAAIGIPRSFIASVVRAEDPKVAGSLQENDPQFVAARDAQVSRVKASVQRIIMGGPDDVEVDVYPDVDWTASGAEWSRVPAGVPSAGGTSGVLVSDENQDLAGLVRAYGPQAGLAVLALTSLLLMTRMVRRSSETVAMSRRRHRPPPSAPDDEELPLAVGPGAVGQAQASESMLTGKELDPDTLRFQELGREVSKMVDSDPEGTADLIRRWIEEP